ncbi:MAG TPA: outer membrane beta-barrel protein [Vicinamibacterales bacterium]
MRHIAPLLLFTTAFSTAAAAQTQPTAIEEVRKNATMHAGPFYVTPVLQLKDLGVDSNVFNAAGDQKSDFMFNLSPKASVWIPSGRRAMISATAATDLVWYATYQSERSIDPQFTVRGDLYFNRLTLFAQDAFLNTRQRPNYEIDLRSRHLENNVLAGGEVKLTPKFSVEVAARRFDTKYDADDFIGSVSLQRTLNRKTTGGQVMARHKVTPLTTISLLYDNLQDRFEYSPARDSNSFRVSPGVEFKPRALIKGRAFVGYRKFEPLHPEILPEFSGVVADLGLSYTVLGATSIGVSFRRDVTYSYEERQPFFIDSSPGISVRRALGRRYDVLVSVDRHTYEYQDVLVDLPAAAPYQSRVDTTWNYSASFGYRLGRDGRIGFGASYWKRESTTVVFRNYDNLVIGTTATYGF